VPETREHSFLRVANEKSAILPGNAVLVSLNSPSVGKLVSFRLVGQPYLGITSGLLVIRQQYSSTLDRIVNSRYYGCLQARSFLR
jgi:hypothetical protein